MSLQETVLHAIRIHALVEPGESLVVGVSGGADSLTLLHLLRRLSAKLGCRLHAATFDHRVRGEASAEDARFVVRTCAAWEIPVTAGAADEALMEQQSGLEARLREARYDFLAMVAERSGAIKVAVAHNADDQAETVLMHLLRGSGVQGLSGMAWDAPLPGHPHLRLIRPLLGITRAEIELYCREHGLQPRDDLTNRDPKYLRNRIRHEILPLLATVNPQVKRALAQLAEIARAENDFLDAGLAPVTEQAFVEAGRISLPRALFIRLHPALQRRYVTWAAGRLSAEGDNVSAARVLAAVEVGLHGQIGAQALLPGGLQLRVEYGALVVERVDAREAADLPLLESDDPLPVAVPGRTPVGAGWALEASLTPLPEAVRMAIPDGSAVILRRRRDGDRFAPQGMGGHTQKVSRWMINHKVPAWLRDHVPLLVVNDEVAVIAYGNRWALAGAYRAGDDSGSAMFLRWTRIDNGLS